MKKTSINNKQKLHSNSTVRHTNKIIKSVNEENSHNTQETLHNNFTMLNVTTNPSQKNFEIATRSTNSNAKSNQRDAESKVSPWLEDYLDLHTMRIKPVSSMFIERLAIEVMSWSTNDDAIVFRDFIDNKHIPEDAYYRWVRTYPELKAAHTLAKGRIGSRREKGAITRKFDGSSVIGSMAMYDQEWKDLLAWKSSLKDQSTSGNVTINLPNITTIPVIEDK